MPKQPSPAPGKMGVKVKMVTGDQLAIAKETAKKLGWARTFSMPAAWATRKSTRRQQVAEAIEKADGFAQVSPNTSSTLLTFY